MFNKIKRETAGSTPFSAGRWHNHKKEAQQLKGWNRKCNLSHPTVGVAFSAPKRPWATESLMWGTAGQWSIFTSTLFFGLRHRSLVGFKILRTNAFEVIFRVRYWVPHVRNSGTFGCNPYRGMTHLRTIPFLIVGCSVLHCYYHGKWYLYALGNGSMTRLLLLRGCCTSNPTGPNVKTGEGRVLVYLDSPRQKRRCCPDSKLCEFTQTWWQLQKKETLFSDVSSSTSSFILHPS